MKSLVIVSNRLPFVVNTEPDTGKLVRRNSAGGLVTALTPLVIKSNGYWIGWSGKELSQDTRIPECEDATSISHGLKSSQIVPMFLSDDTYKNYYNGMCNASLWPLLHSLPNNAVFNLLYWNSYIEVNASFSKACLETLEKLELENKQESCNENKLG